MNRRTFVMATLAAAAPVSLPDALAAAAPQADGQPFDFERLKAMARARAGAAFQPPPQVPEAIRRLSWDQYQSIRFREERGLWAGAGLPFQLRFFHPGLYFTSTVRMHEVVAGHAHTIRYDPAMFDLGGSGLDARALPADLGFVGFRLYVAPDWARDVIAFLGASYFRAVGEDKQYGLSARGLAIGSGAPAEEFPSFTAYWFERPAADARALTLYALLDSPSVAGAYRFVLRPGPSFDIDVLAVLYPRRAIERIGIAPLTSMFLKGENDQRIGNDWRPEIHDSDGLQVWTGAGEWLWRPLTNPARLRVNAYLDHAPRGFGLLQRDRAFDHYQDDGVFYDRRPGVWIRPSGNWGAGAVTLVEIPTPDETNDNIAAFWTPARPPAPGEELVLGYAMSWGARPPVAPPMATVQATRTGIGGVVGQAHSGFSWRFAVDFAGGELPGLAPSSPVEAVVEASRGHLEIVSARPLAALSGWRAMFDLRPTDAGEEPINLRLFLRCQGRALTETWMYQWTPPPVSERR